MGAESTSVKYLADLRSRVLKDNKVPGTSAGTRAAEALARAQGLLQDSWERARLGCVSSQVPVWTRGA